MRRLLVPVLVVAGTIGLAASARRPAPSSPAFDAIFDRYLHGDADAAVLEMATWSEVRVASDATPLPDTADPWLRVARALLHTEASLANERFASRQSNERPAGSNLPMEWSTHHAYRVVESLVSDRDIRDPLLQEFCREWLVFASSFGRRVHSFEGPFSETARRYAGDNPGVMLLMASAAESHFGPLIDDPPMTNAMNGLQWNEPISTPRGIFSRVFRREAEPVLRKLAATEPSLIEARLRLARIAYNVGSPAEAQGLFERVLADGQVTGDRWVSDMAAVFLAQQLETTGGRPEDAARAYQRAIDLDPAAQPAYIGLSQFCLVQGRADEAWAVIDDMFAAAGESGSLWNPWSLYGFAQFYQSVDRLASMRKLVAEHFGNPRQSALPFPYEQPRPVLIKPRPQPAPPRTEADSVRVDVSVMDGDRSVSGLSADDFIVLDKGVVQRLDSAAKVPHLAVALAVDISHRSIVPLRDHLVRAALDVLDAMRPSDRASVITIADELRLLARGESNLSKLRSLVMGLENRRHAFTALWDGAYAAASLVARDKGRPYVLLLGEGNSSGDAGDNVSWLTLGQTLDRLKASGAVVDGVWVPRRPNPPDVGYTDSTDIVYGRGSANDLIKTTGGRVFSTDDENLTANLQARLDELRQGYVLTYTPTGVTSGDGWHKITVRLKDKRGQIQARPGYYSRQR